MIYFFVTLVLTLLIVFNLPVFGKHPSGKTLRNIKLLNNYTNGEFKNQSHTPTKPDDVTYWMMIKTMLKGNKNGSPQHIIPHQKPDLSRSNDFKLTWFGHSSYLIQVDQINILVDPVFNERPSPFQFIGTKQFSGTNFITVNDLPELDIVLISHDHYDHLEYDTILKLKDKTKFFITSVGVGAHLVHWGIDEQKITELNWSEQASPMANIKFTAAPARHFSGRLFKRNQTLWSSFVLQTSKNKIYLGADSGYDTHFKTTGKEHGPFDLAILECGQYNTMWPFIHMLPEQVVQASLDLNAKYLLPVHWGKYKLALHDWDEPIKILVAKAEDLKVDILTPQLGQTFSLSNDLPKTKWWLNL
ncbi:MBL fold metallo-hydrolase [Pedobacter cryotolerans]|uniref:MBL fold metallo-hydrolase n=1 Tax=Pedobacter cryotolerans TaxID=2571270 RepID=A0A4U1C9I6_9SPHI|nr:MBL fold metallo-hydrolase [Pedobacter cryotolerans]TKC02478.1 MBL fold metallo-hydrolase [Pedobacter cryotolerans]